MHFCEAGKNSFWKMNAVSDDLYSGLNLNQNKARQRRTGLNLIHYMIVFARQPLYNAHTLTGVAI